MIILVRFSSVPYEKGFNFLYHLELVLGGPAVFEPFLKAYYHHFASKSVRTLTHINLIHVLTVS
jgi:aminopeptidase N